MEIVLALVTGANITITVILYKKIKAMETKKDPYEKYRNHEGLLTRKAVK